MKRFFPLTIHFAFAITIVPLQAQPGFVDGTNYSERAAIACRVYAQTPPHGGEPRDVLPLYDARIQTGTDVAATLQAVDKMMDAALENHGTHALDPFSLHAIVHSFCVCRDQWPLELAAKFRAFAARYDFTKGPGVSLNYEFMQDGGGWLAAQEWPDLKDRAGHNAKQIQSLCGKRLLMTFAQITAENSPEYEAPLYYGTDLMAVRMLAEFARDAEMQRAAQLTLEWMLIQTASYWHHGYYISSAGRAKYWGSNDLSPDNPGPTTAMAFLLFGGNRPARLAGVPAGYWLAHPGKCLPLDWLSAWSAALPETRLVTGSVQIPSHGIFVRKMAWFTTGYGLASERDDGTWEKSYLYKESRRTMLKWISDKPESSFTVLQENRVRPQQDGKNKFAYGENPYAQVMQHEGTLIGLYDVPASYGFWKIAAPFTTHGAIARRSERDGWVFCHGGSMLFAFRSMRPAHWAKPNAHESLDLLECDESRNGWILETSPLAPFAGGGIAAELDRFADAVLSKTKIAGDTIAVPPRLIFTNLAGHTLDLRWHPPAEKFCGQCVLDGKPVDYDSFPLLATPGVRQTVGGPLLITLPDGGARVYDFKHWAVEFRP